MKSQISRRGFLQTPAIAGTASMAPGLTMASIND
jgi:hypothetical protein